MNGERAKYRILRRALLPIALLLGLSASIAEEEALAEVTAEISVTIPERVVVYTERAPLSDNGDASGWTSPSSSESFGLLSSVSGISATNRSDYGGEPLTSRGGGKPEQPPYCPTDPDDPELCLRDNEDGDDTHVVFDLACATLGAVPARCKEYYPESPDGRLLDDEGRPYPPIKYDSNGKWIPGSKQFPQYFTHPSMRLHIYTSDKDWSLSAEMIDEPADSSGMKVLGAERFAVHSILTGCSGNYCDPSPEWKCLGFHEHWTSQASHVCPAPSGSSGVLLEEVHGFPGGWQSITLGIKLLLDGSETPGEYTGMLRYTYTKL